MKKLAKWLAVFALVVIVGAAWKSIVTTRAEDPAVCAPNGTMKILGPACGPQANIHPDINIKLRGFERTDGVMNVIDLGAQSTDVDPKHPNIDTMFDNVLEHAIVGLYHVGVWEGKNVGGTYKDWVHLVGFSTFPTDNIRVPRSGYDLGCGFEVMVLFADDNSITLKYTLDDNMVSGYGIHILGIKVRDDILAKYKAADAAGRKELPVLMAGDIVGQPAEAAIWVSVRDTGAFLDPRSCQDFWTNCSFEGRLPQASTWDLPPEYDQSSSPRGAKSPACDISGFQKQAYYPPLGSLQECPVEFPTVGKVETSNVTLPPTGDPANTCQYRNPEPAMCKNPPVPGSSDAEAFCNGPTYAGWCRPSSCEEITRQKRQCGGEDHTNATGCGKYLRGFCLGQGPKGTTDPIYQEVLACSGPDADAIGYCWSYFDEINKTTPPPTPKPQTNPAAIRLPACVPTANKTQAGRCTSACGDKLTITESLGFNILNNCATGTCKATVSLDPTKPLYAPLAKNLADYFAGSLDAGAVAEGTISEERYEHLKKSLALGATSSADLATLTEAFDRAGVARKLLPPSVQDQLKCQFIKYVKNKIDAKQNTKYKFLVDGKETFFNIGGVSVKDYVLPPKFDQDFKNYDPADMRVGCSELRIDPPSYISSLTDWTKSPSGIAWIDVPLFDNDEAQGKIEFVSGGVFTNELNPIQTSIPEIRRLNSATNIIEKSLLAPETALPPDERPKAITPQSRFLTIGPEIRPKIVLNACTKTPELKKLYDDYDALQEKNAKDTDPTTISQIYYPEPNTSSYTLGVECLQNGGSLAKDPTSLSKVCSVGPEGQINCFQQLRADEIAGTSGRRDFPNVAVQTRNVTPYLFDTYLQTIDQANGVLRIFKPYAIAAASDKLGQLQAAEDFEKNFLPLPAESNEIKYVLNSNTGVTLKPEDGWTLLFDKLGGIYTAKEFVLDLLKPAK